MSRARPDRPATIYDVAKAAGVSHQTVSKVLRGLGGMRPETRERVEVELRRLNYRPNVGARALARSQQKRIGVVGYETFESSTSKVLSGVSEVLDAAGYLLEIVSVDPVGDVEAIAAALERINGTDIAGVLATSPTSNVREALTRVRFRMPVFLDVNGDQRIGADGRRRSVAAELVMDHLAELGHQRIAFVGGPAGWDSAGNREDVYLERVAAPRILGHGDWSAASGYRVMVEGDLGDATAVFVANDRMALGVLRALDERGVRVPDDVSVVGIDDIPEAGYFSPPLSTVHIDFTVAGEVAAQSLLTLIERPGEAMPLYPRSRLVARASSASLSH
ncbi:LacI family DNA-binding transcriptional regulator [Microbacterium invictum]|uniref:LacI family transcriptional regulator n=1 Tax=Microbacterium invictum TaxID=515415 RepID=A0AA40SRQ2_9MICO|nr:MULTISPECIES: LacI family DNA-binding transcriptional regulator [Microbacterium]MBB4141185.1 LacI family transcriptional regulator [Microbacterium invictum]